MQEPKVSITNLIYKKLFGMNKKAMTAYAAYHYPKTYRALGRFHQFDTDAMMRDCLSLESLQALNEIEETSAVFISNSAKFLANGTISPEQWQNSVIDFIEVTVETTKAKMGSFEIWGV